MTFLELTAAVTLGYLFGQLLLAGVMALLQGFALRKKQREYDSALRDIYKQAEERMVADPDISVSA